MSPTTLFNEKQETMFDNKLSKAADNYLKSTLELVAWKKKQANDAATLISEMKRCNVFLLNLEQNRQIRYQIVTAKEKITVKELKAKKPRGRNGHKPRI